MNIYEAAGPLPDGDTRISFAARLRYNSRCHGAAGIPLGPASIADNHIGFCGWADMQNGQPIYRAWRRWCLECMINKYDED